MVCAEFFEHRPARSGSGGVQIPLGGAPDGAWDTLLLPNTDYGIRAVVSNDSSVPASTNASR